jgi:hypothetical protein
MSQRIGMANGRCITSYDSGRIMNDVIMAQNSIDYQNNYKYRMFLQSQGPDALNLPFQNAACRTGGGCGQMPQVLKENN